MLLLVPFLGLAICFGITFVFVSSLYIWNVCNPSLRNLGRDNPRVVSRRCISVLLSTGFALCITFLYTKSRMSVPGLSIPQISRTVIQTIVLMLGPIVHQLPLSRSSLDILLVFRNLFIAPFCEEIVFRFCFLHILVESGFTETASGLLAPFIFAFAHVHHHSGKALVSIFFSIAHTCFFGWIAFYFLKRRSLWDAIISHMLCNLIGLPCKRSAIFGGKCLTAVYITGLVIFLLSDESSVLFPGSH